VFKNLFGDGPLILQGDCLTKNILVLGINISLWLAVIELRKT
jgi:hypothetical protein